MRKTVLITGIGGDISQGVATILRESRPELRLIGVDTHTRHAGQMFVDCFSTVPGAGEAGYLSELQAVIARHSVGFVFPMSEPELAVIRPLQDLISKLEWITAGNRVIAAGLDKLKTAQALSDLGLPTPWTLPVNDGPPISFPCILKNRFGSGSRAVFVVTNRDDADYLVKRYPDAIFQEMLEPADKEVTCAVYRKHDGEIATLLMLRRLAGGFTGWAKVIKDEETRLMCERIAEGLDLIGSMNIQLRLTNMGPRVFEINPRLSSTVLMRHRIGFSDVLWALDEAEGKSISFPNIPVNRAMARVQGALVLEDIGAIE